MTSSNTTRPVHQPTLAKKERRLAALSRQIARLEKGIAGIEQSSNRIIWLRLALFLGGFALTGVLFFTSGPRPALLSLPFWFLPFLLLVFIHRRIQAALLRHNLYLALKEQHRARMTLSWDDLPPPRYAQSPAGHPFALDLDLLGPYGMHRLLDTSATTAGSGLLSAWLLATIPDPAGTKRRQQLVQELVPLVIFRDRLNVMGRAVTTVTTVSTGSTGGPATEPVEVAAEQRLETWLQQPPAPASFRPVLIALILLGATALGLLVLNLSAGWPAYWLAPFLLYVLVYFSISGRAGNVFGQILDLRDGFLQLAAVLGFLEAYRYPAGSRLQDLCSPLSVDPARPSTQIRRLNLLSAGVGLAQNYILGLVLNLFFPWNLFFAYQLERMRRRLQDRVPVWLAIWHELEALSALATFHYLNPHYTVPELVEGRTDTPFTGRGIGHPLLPDGQKVGNDFSFPAIGHLAIITGSNMAGKSTFLRALGLNLILAYAGGPVDAASLTAGYFRLFSSIRVTDSVTDGISYFYAEVQRLKALLAAVQDEHPLPVFFLIDEIFRGTNNRERLIGSQAYVRELAGRDSIGAIATHDLELVHLADDPLQNRGAVIHNFHFRDDVQEGRMVFDYRLRPGPCPTTNALAIMRLAGLPVPDNPALT